jgi:hypothetical protein
MDDQARIPRSRGGVCGVMLILLGLWGGLAPFVGPYLHFGFTPDKAWEYTQGRLYYSAVPGAVTLLGGVLVLATRNRAIGITGAVIAALAGAWFGLGDGFVTVVLKKPAISLGSALPPVGNVSASMWAYLESIAFFGGLGLLVVLFAAVAIGRFSLLAARDIGTAPDPGYYETQTGFPTVAGQFPVAEQYPGVTSQYPDSPGYPTVSSGQ